MDEATVLVLAKIICKQLSIVFLFSLSENPRGVSGMLKHSRRQPHPTPINLFRYLLVLIPRQHSIIL